MIGSHLIENDEILQKKYFEELNKLQESHDGILQIETLHSNNKEKEGKASASSGFKINFLGMIKGEIKFESSYKENDALRETARRIFKTKASELIKIINAIILDYKLQNNNDKEILLIIDDLEKKENIDSLYLKDLKHLDSLNMVKIITMPIHLRRTQTFNSKDVREFALKLNDFEGDANQNDIRLLREVIEKRITNLELITSETIDKAIAYSGGNLRQLLRLIQLSANEADTFGATKIEGKEIKYAIEFLQRGLSSPTMIMQIFLKEIPEFKEQVQPLEK